MEKEEPGFPPDQPASRRDSHGEPAENSVSTHKARSENIDMEQTKGISVGRQAPGTHGHGESEGGSTGPRGGWPL